MKKKNVLFCGALALGSSLYAQQRPNIIYILADDMGSGDVSAINKESLVHTKSIDRLATEGMIFTDAHTSSSVSTPTRYSIMTGRYNWRSTLQNGVLWSYDSLLIGKQQSTVAGMLRANGYHTAVIGKWHLGLGWQFIDNSNKKVDFTKKLTSGAHTVGFEHSYIMPASLDIPPYVYIENGMTTGIVKDTIPGKSGYGFYRKGEIADNFVIEQTLDHFTDKAVQYIQSKASSTQPFFLYFPLTAPHTPILPAERFKGKSKGTDYTDFLLHVDEVVGRVMEAVQQSGIEQNTLIVFTADNGCSTSAQFEALKKFNHHPGYLYRGNKADTYEGGHRVPFIVKYPGVTKPGSISNTTTCVTNLYATCAEIVGVQPQANEGVDSYSILNALQGNGTESPAIIHHSINGNFSIRKGDWKLIVAPGSGGWSAPRPGKEAPGSPKMQLFNLKENISEKSEYNLYDKEPSIAHRLFVELIEIIEKGRSTPGKVQKNDVPIKVIK